MKSEVEPNVNQHWQRGSFPFEIVPGFRQLGLAGLPYQGFGCPGRSFLLDGMVAMELARTDPSIATFSGVHGGLSMGSIYLCGSEEQKERYLPAMARFDKIGAFGLTEPDVGSGASGGLKTTARRDGDTWILNGQKKWIGNATFGDLTVIWARDVADGQVKGFIVANDSPGFSTTKLEDKIALRIVQNAVITLDDVAVSEDDRLQNANSFRDTAEVLRMTRAGVAWMAVGCARGASRERVVVRDITRTVLVGPSPAFNCGPNWCGCSATSRRRGRCARATRNCRMRGAEDRHSSLAKACAPSGVETVGYARELLGGNGILLEHNVGRFVADAEAIYSYEGTREMNTLIVGRAITGLSAFV
jgi:glutaryl-CoA dehydrogenase